MRKTIIRARQSSLTFLVACLALGASLASAHAAAPLTAATLQPGQLVISEILPDPTKVGDTTGEWFELYNPFDVAIDLNGLVVRSMNGASVESFVITNAPQVAPRDYYVLGRSANPATNGGVSVDYAWGSALSLGNTTDYLRIDNPDGTMLVRASWMSSVAGRSFEVHTGILPTLEQSDFVQPLAGTTFGLGDLGTPGSINTHLLNVSGIVAPPVPEPETWALMGAGLSGIALARRRKRTH